VFGGPWWRHVDHVVLLEFVCFIIVIVYLYLLFRHLIRDRGWLCLAPRADNRVAFPLRFTHLVVILQLERGLIVIFSGLKGHVLLFADLIRVIFLDAAVDLSRV